MHPALLLRSLDVPGLPLNPGGLPGGAGQYTEVEQLPGREVPEADPRPSAELGQRESWTGDIQSRVIQGQGVQLLFYRKGN